METDYERNTGLVIVETFQRLGIAPDEVPAVLVANHAPFTWGRDPFEAIDRAEALEFVARLEWRVRAPNPEAPRPESERRPAPRPSAGSAHRRRPCRPDTRTAVSTRSLRRCVGRTMR